MSGAPLVCGGTIAVPVANMNHIKEYIPQLHMEGYTTIVPFYWNLFYQHINVHHRLRKLWHWNIFMFTAVKGLTYFFSFIQKLPVLTLL